MANWLRLTTGIAYVRSIVGTIPFTGNVTVSGTMSLGNILLKGTGTAPNNPSLEVRNLTDTQYQGLRVDNLQVTDGGGIYTATRGLLISNADGQWGIRNAAGTSQTLITAGGVGISIANDNFRLTHQGDGIGLLRGTGSNWDRLQFGGTTSAFPALKRNSTAIEVKLADDTAYTNIDALAFGSTAAGRRVSTSMATPASLANGDWWVESDTGAVTGAHGLLKARLNGATVTLGGDFAATTSQPSNPTGTTSTTGLMMGLAGAITPVITGRVVITVCGNIVNSTAADGAKVEIRTGTGTAPTNGAALTGTVRGTQQVYTVVVGAADSVPFNCTALVTGLTLGTAIWIDVDLAAIAGGTASINNVNIVAHEI